MSSTIDQLLAPTSAASVAPSITIAASCQHDVQFYFEDQFLVRSLGDFFRTALAEGRSAIVVATKSHRDNLAEQLRNAGVPLTAVVQQGRYVALDAAETLAQFMRNGNPQESLFRNVIGNVISCSLAATRREEAKVAIFGEMVALLWQRGETQAALRLEQFWNQISDSHAFQLRCAYPIAGFDRERHIELFSRICGEHQIVIPAEGYTALVDENDRLRTIARLQQTEQVLKTEVIERRMAQAKTAEVQSRNEQLVNEIGKREAIEEELRKFTRRLLAARDQEQRRIAVELHENTAQLLSALSLYFGVLHEEKASLNPRVASVVASSRTVSDSLLSEIRKLSHLLHPPTLDDMGLGSALREYVDYFRASSDAQIDLQIPDNLGRFNHDLELTVFRIVEEALANFHPHSSNASTAVRLSRSATNLAVQIQHYKSATTGTDMRAGTETRITGIHERVMEHGGSVQFTSDRSGSLICVSLPLEGEQAEPG